MISDSQTIHPMSALEALRGVVQGRVIVPSDAEYDVAGAVRYARENDLRVAVQSTGHGNIRPADDCLLLLTGEMKDVRIDPIAQRAWIEAGAQWGAVLAAAQDHAVAPLLGSSPTVGAIGYTLGGGLGWLARKYGVAADSVLRFELVTGDGEISGKARVSK